MSELHHAPKQVFADGKEYALPHVFMYPDQLQTFIDEMTTVFDGTADPISDVNLAPVPSEMQFSDIRTSIGAFSAQAYKDRNAPYPMGKESVGFAVKDMDYAVSTAKRHGVKVLARWEVVGNQEAMTEWPGGLRIQFYAYPGEAPEMPIRESVSNTRYYLPPQTATKFINAFLAVTGGKIVQDGHYAGEEIGLPGEVFRRVNIDSSAGLVNIIILSDKQKGRLVYPYTNIQTDFNVDNLDSVLARAKARGVSILVRPEYTNPAHPRAVLGFTGGYVIELHQKTTR